MKRSKLVWTALVFAVVAALLGLAATQTTAGAAGPEIVPNGGFETANGTLPASWRNDYWGNLTASFSYPSTGAHSGTRLSRIDVTAYTDGGAKWSFDPQPVTPNTLYTYSSWYRSSSPSEMLVVYTTTGGSVAYQWLANVPAAANWTQFATTFTSPAGVATMTVFQTITSVGFLETDDFSITGPDIVVPPSATVTAPTAGATVSGATTLTATTTGSIAGVTFLVDGVAVGTEDTTAPYSVIWNSTGVANGSHNITAQARPVTGANVTSAPVSVTVSNTAAPTVSVTAPTAGSTVSGTTNLTASTTGSVAGVTFLVDGIAVGAEDTTAPYSLSWNSATVTNATHSVTAQVRPTSGATVTSNAVSFIVSNVVVPTVNVTAPVAGATLSGTTNLTASTTGSVAGVTFQIDGVTVGTEDTTAPYSVSWNTTTATNATHTVTAIARPPSGANVTSAAVNVTVNNVAPMVTVTLSAPAANATVSGTTNITATTTGPVAGVTFLVDGVAVGAEDTTAPYSASWNTSTVVNGSHSLSARARPTVGTPVTSATRAVNVNNALAPTITLTAPAAGATVTGTVPISATISGLTTGGVTFLVDGVAVGTDSSSPYSINWNSTTATNGSHLVSARVNRLLGGTITSNPRTITVNNFVVPTISVSAPTAGSTVAGVTNITANATGSVAGVTFRVDGVTLGAEDTTAPYSVAWDTGTAAQGAHSITAVARPTTGANVTSAAVNVTVNNVSVSVTAPAAGATVTGTTDLTATTAGSVAGVTFRVDGVTVGAEDTTAPYTVPWDSTTATNGAHAITAVARPTSGASVTSAAVDVSVSNVIPTTVTVTAPTAGAVVAGTTNLMATTTGSIAGVTFRVDGVAVGAEDTTAPYSVAWNSTTATDGAHSITAEARPTTGSNITSAAVDVTVSNVTVNVTAPTAGATVSGAVELTAATTGSVAGVTFLVDGVAVGAEDTTAPYTVPWDSATIANGNHAVTAQARPVVGTTVTSAAVTITVSNVTVTVTAPAAGATVTGATNLTATANAAVAGVTFLIDNTPVGAEDTTAPYSVSWDSVVVANGSHTLIAQARRTTGTTVTSVPVTFTVNNVISTPGGGGVVPNPSLETAAAGNPNMAANWRADSWGNNTTTFSYPTGGAHGGTKSSRIDMTRYVDGGAKWSFDPVLVTPNTAYDYSSWYKSNQPSEVLVVYETTTGTIAYQWLNNVPAAANWTEYRTQFFTPANARTMTVFQSITAVGFLQTDDFTITPAAAGGGFNRPLISLTFDDGTAPHYTLAYPKLQATGMKATFYLISSYTDDPGPPVQLTSTQIRTISNAGHEIGSHTVDHEDLVTLSSAQQTAELANSKSALEALIGKPVTEFASPYGSYNTQVLDKIKTVYQSHRTVINGFNTKASTDVYQLKQQLILNTTTLADVQAWIAAARAQNSWLILTFHDIYNNPDTYDITPANLNAFLDAVANSGITVLPVGQARAEVTAQLG